MKRLLSTLLALVAFLSPSVFADEKAALENFRKETNAVEAWMKEKQKASEGKTPALMREMVGKMKAIPTEGLPADLKDPWIGFVGSMDIITKVMGAEKPTDPAEIAELKKRLDEVIPKLAADLRKLEEVSEKYYLPTLAKFRPQ